MSTKDATLIVQFRSGNTEAFNQLVVRWQQRIHRLAYRYFNSHDEATEITQRTFIKVYQKVHLLDDCNAFPAWIYRIANNLCRDETKRAGRRKATPIEEVPNRFAPVTTQQPMEQKEWETILQQALQKLPEEQRMIVIMKEYEEMKFNEIADILELPESTVKSRMYAGLTKLRGTFEQWNINQEALYYE